MSDRSNDLDAVYVISDVAPDGTYICAIQASQDVAFTLSETDAVDYARMVCAAATHADYDAAVFAQLSTMGVPKPDVAAMIGELRGMHRTEPGRWPLRFEPILSATSLAPFLHVWLGDKMITQWTPDDARSHAMHVLDVIVGVALDTAYYRWLHEVCEVSEFRARAAVGDLINHRTEASHG